MRKNQHDKILKGESKKQHLSLAQYKIIHKLCFFYSLLIVWSQIVAHTQMETRDGPNKPNTINL